MLSEIGYDNIWLNGNYHFKWAGRWKTEKGSFNSYLV